MKTAFYFCTRNSKAQDTFAFKSLQRIKLATLWEFTIIYKENNNDGLSLNYNSVLEKHGKDYDNIVFIHDDVYIDDLGVVNKLEKAYLTPQYRDWETDRKSTRLNSSHRL